MTEFWRILDEPTYNEGRDGRLTPDQLIADQHTSYGLRVRWPEGARDDGEFGREFLALIVSVAERDGRWEVAVCWRPKSAVEVADLWVDDEGVVFAEDDEGERIEMGYFVGGDAGAGSTAPRERELVPA